MLFFFAGSACLGSASGQLAEFLREEIQNQRWSGKMPGESWMVTELGVGRDTVRGAMAHLEAEGVLSSDGQGRRRRIVIGQDALFIRSRSIRVRILLYEKQDRGDLDNASVLAQLLAAGFDADFTSKSLKELGMGRGRVASYLKRNPSDFVEVGTIGPVPKRG